MTWQVSPHLVGFALGAVASLVLLVLALQRRDQRTAIPTAAMLFACGVWASADAVRIATTNETLSLYAHNVRFVGSTMVVFAVMVFVLEYTGRDQWLTPKWLGAMGAPFLFMLVLVWTEPTGAHSLVRADVTVVERGGLSVFEFEYGPWFWVNAVYSYLLLVGGFALFILEYIRQQSRTYRRQVLALTIALLVPWTLNGFHVIGVTAFDFTAIGLVVTGAMFYASLFWFQLLDLVPIARGSVVESIEHGFLVLDDEDMIVDANEQATRIFGRKRSETVGTAASNLFSDHPSLRERLRQDEEFTVDIERAGKEYETELSRVHTSGGREVGRVLLLRDVTDQRRRQRQLEDRTARLERQNERLDRFASIVSHDLRNPINVARGYLDMARETDDPTHFGEVEESLDRMEHIIDDVLQLARHGQDVDDPEPTDLETVARAAWSHVETAEASLSIETAVTIEADESRLQQLLENLFRNALDHGPEDVTVTVGGTEHGFFVADDGPGIPPEERDEVFEQGFTTASDGTGLGLSIVSAIAEAHGWDVSATDSESGGARFEVSAVTTLERVDPPQRE